MLLFYSKIIINFMFPSLNIMKHLVYILFFVLVVSSILPSCIKEKQFSIIPAIEFKQYITYGLDSADCIIKFKDGDGDIGILDGDTTSPNDFRMKYLYLDTLSHTFKPYNANLGSSTFDTLFYSYRVPNITPTGQYKALDGEIKAKLRSAPLYGPGHTVVKFEITLRDRAGHLSNMVTTNEITVPLH
jgi:hypothetical protein